jgi:ribosomal protein S18 acetylase RimI-like enzyme
MPVVCLHDKRAIASVLRRNLPLNIYSIGDLDPFFWPFTTWFGLAEGDYISDVVLLYTSATPPILLAAAVEPAAGMRRLLEEVRHLLPAEFYTHITPSLIDIFEPHYAIDLHGPHLKMELTAPDALNAIDTTGVAQIYPADASEVQAFYNASYPGNWFDPRMLDTEMYFGQRIDGRLACIAGIHVYSPAERVAALGNIVTRPDARGKGLATRVTARLCRELLRHVDHIGLNVKADNAAAIACYRRLGFTPVAPYLECNMQLKCPELRAGSRM